MRIVFTDLDGTLLDHSDYSWEAAKPAIETLRRRNIPWIFATSKTRAEVEHWRAIVGNEHPFVVENGGAAFLPSGYFEWAIHGASGRNGYQVLEWGVPYDKLVSALQSAARESRCGIRGFHQMDAREVAEVCDLPLEQAALARQREYDEPFLILQPGRAGRLLAAIEEQGLSWTRGGRFWHIAGRCDKAVAVVALRNLYERANGKVVTIGLGDSLNDAAFLGVVDVPVLVRSRHVAGLKARIRNGLVTRRPGPAGWNEAVSALVQG